MKDILHYRNRYLNQKAQIAVIQQDGTLLDSCDTLYNFKPYLGKNAFQAFDFLKGLEPALRALIPGGDSFLLPALQFSTGGDSRFCDMEFILLDKNKGSLLLWTLHDMTREYSRLRLLHQAKNESLIESEIIRQQHKLLNNYTHKLEKANEELDRFAYIVSHDLKTPLRGIRNLAEWIVEDLGADVPEDIKDHCSLMQRQVLKMDALIEGVLQYSRAGREELTKEPVMVTDLIKEIAQGLTQEKNIRIEVVEDMPLLTTYRLLLEQVFTNLIGNAVKHHDKADGFVRVSFENQDDFVRFTVADNGPGIAPEYHSKVFEIFQTLTKNDPTSTGVGLAIVQKIVQEAGGTLSLESEAGNGAKFSFTWPKE